jgi:hypothetical protein
MELLQHLARSAANGELICAASQVEIHVFLQAGRIAWATDSRHPFAFATHLQTIARIDPDTLRQVVEECRRERLPLGETLVEWGLASWEGVRTALAHQIELAVEQLVTLDAAQTLFLERGFRDYNERLTFEVSAFVRSELPPAETEAPPEPSPLVANERRGLARQLRGSVEGLAWVEVLDGQQLSDGDPPCPSPRVPLDLVRTTVLDDSDFVAIRSARSSVIGLSMARPRSIWCRLSAESTFGAVVSAIWAVAGAADKAVDHAPTRPDAATWSIGDSDDPANQALRAFQLRAHEVLGAIVMTEQHQAIAGSGCSLIEPARCADVARRRSAGLLGDTLPLTDPGEHALGSIGFSLKTMVSGEARLWCFGAELERGDSLWMFLDRRTSQGLGWAYLTALTRALARARGADT